jgi:cytochrome c2
VIKRAIFLSAVLVAGTFATGPVGAAGDATHGEEVFATCAACHSPEAGENMFGPSLFGVVGRPSASVDGYSYSSALQALKIVWTPANIDKFITDPTAFAPGTKMPVKLTSASDRADVIAYLATLD